MLFTIPADGNEDDNSTNQILPGDQGKETKHETKEPDSKFISVNYLKIYLLTARKYIFFVKCNQIHIITNSSIFRRFCIAELGFGDIDGRSFYSLAPLYFVFLIFRRKLFHNRAIPCSYNFNECKNISFYCI